MESGSAKLLFLGFAREGHGGGAAHVGPCAARASRFGLTNELRGGDDCDARIRRQIGACALFLPIISLQTHERSKGYFRLEWKLAVEQTHQMIAGMPFLVPVVVDDTARRGALVPDEFLRVNGPAWRKPSTPQFVEGVSACWIGLTQTAPTPAAPARRLADSARPGPGEVEIVGPVLFAAAAVILIALGVWKVAGGRQPGAGRIRPPGDL